MRHAYGEDVYDEGLTAMDADQLVEVAGNVTGGVPIATPVFDGANEADVNDPLDGGIDTRASLSCSTAAPASNSSGRSRWANVHAETAPSGGRQESTRAPSDRTVSLLSSRWAARRSSVVSGSVRWRSGRWKLTAPPTPCRKC